MFQLRRPELYAAFSLRLRRMRRGRIALVVTILAGSVLSGSAMLRAQGPVEGAVYGVIQDSQRHNIGGAEITLRSVDGNDSVEVVMGADGTLLAPHLAPGSYALSVRGVLSEPLTVVPGETLEFSATVWAGGILVVLARADAGSESTGLLPDENDDGLNSAHGLTPMQDGASLDGATANQSYGSVPVGTGRNPAPDPEGDADSADLNTGPANGMARGRHAGMAYLFSQSAVREFHGSGQSYSAQAGHAGDVVTAVSRSGTETLHGSGFFSVRSQAFAASDPLAIATSYSNGVVTSGEVKPHDLRENFGGTIGGPLGKTSGLVFFYTIEQQLRGFPAISSPANPNFYNLTATQRALLGTRGVTANAINTALNYLTTLTGSTPRQADQTLNFGRVDWRAHKGWATAVEYNAVRWNSPAGLIDAPVVARGRASLGNANGSLDAVVLRVTKNFSAHTINEARFSYVRDLQYESPQTPLPGEPAISPGGLAPEVNIAPNGLLLGTPASLSQRAYPEEKRVQIADTVTLVRGRHLVALGGAVSFVNDYVATLANASGTFSYDSGATGGFAGGLVDFLTDYTFSVNAYPNGGCPRITAANHLFCFRSFSQSFGEDAVTFSTQEWTGFLEDTWRPRSNLTIHAGARYEYTRLPLPMTPNAALDAIFGSQGATGSFPEDRNNLGPRAALTYEPFGVGRGVVRLGYGAFFGRVPGATIQSALTNTALAGSTTRIRIKPSTIVACPQAPAQGFGYPCAFMTEPPGVVATTTSAMVLDRRFRLPVVQQGSLSFEREIGHGTRLSLAYVFNLDRQLPGSTDINIAPATSIGTFQLQGGTGASGVQDGEIFRLPVYSARVSSSFGPVTDIVSNVNATYQGVTLGIESQPARSLRMRADYIRSKAIDYGQNQSATPRTNGQFDPFTKGYDKGLSSLNYPWALRAVATWTPVEYSGREWIRLAASGWEIAPIVTSRSGRPYSLDLSGGTNLQGGHESLNGSGGSLYLPTVGRNTLRLPPTVNVDLRVGRGFRTGRHTSVFASAEAFNLLNHMNVSSVSQRAYLVGTPVAGITPLVFQNAAAIAAEGLNTQPFGTPTAASTSLTRERRIQLSLRVEF